MRCSPVASSRINLRCHFVFQPAMTSYHLKVTTTDGLQHLHLSVRGARRRSTACGLTVVNAILSASSRRWACVRCHPGCAAMSSFAFFLAACLNALNSIMGNDVLQGASSSSYFAGAPFGRIYCLGRQRAHYDLALLWTHGTAVVMSPNADDEAE